MYPELSCSKNSAVLYCVNCNASGICPQAQPSIELFLQRSIYISRVQKQNEQKQNQKQKQMTDREQNERRIYKIFLLVVFVDSKYHQK